MMRRGALLGRRLSYSTDKALRVFDDHFCPAVHRSPKGNNIVCQSARGAYVTDVSGRRYLDFQTGIGVANTGHSHPRVVAAITKQIQDGIHLQQNCTGAEAVESAVKLARHETGKQNVIVFNGGFHGRSLTTLAMTSSKGVYRINYGPFPPGIHTTKYPYCLHCPSAPAGGGCCGDALESLRTMLKEQTAPSETAAIVLEPILGEGGYILPPAGFFKSLRALCDEHNIMLVADEVQSGVGRTGKWWGIQHEGVIPDILVFAKAIASGVPLSGIMTRPEFMKKSPAGSMGGTYGATAIAAAAAVETLNVIHDEGLLSNATERGEQLQLGLRALAKAHPGTISDIRGRGCMVGLEFAAPAGSGFAGAVTVEAMARGLLLFTTGWRETIRLIPPLIVTKEQCETALEVIGQSIEAVAKRG